MKHYYSKLILLPSLLKKYPQDPFSKHAAVEAPECEIRGAKVNMREKMKTFLSLFVSLPLPMKFD